VSFARRFGGMGLRRFARQARRGGIKFLVDYLAGTFTRASVGSFFDPRDGFGGFVAATSAANWLAVNVARILLAGAILMEEARTNDIDQSADLSAWTMASGTGTETGGQAAPDGGTDAYRIEDTDAGGTTRWNGALITAVVSAYAASVFVLKDSDASRFPEWQITQVGATIVGGTIGVQINTATGATSTRIGTPDWVRVVDAGDSWRLEVGLTVSVGGTVRPTLYPAVTDVIGTVNVAAVGAITPWGMQFEAGGSASSPIRTAGAIATRAGDFGFVPQAAVDPDLFSVGFEIDIWPEHNSGTLGHASGIIYNTTASNQSYLRLHPQNTTNSRVWYRSATSGALQTANLTFVAGDKITIRVEHQVLVTVSVNDVVTATINLGALVDAYTPADLYVGGSAAGTLPVTGLVISRPRPL